MLIQLLLAIVMVVMTVTVHLLGLAALVRLLRARHGLVRRVRKSALTLLLGHNLSGEVKEFAPKKVLMRCDSCSN